MQDRQTGGKIPRTPRWRGIAPLHELRAAGIPIALASDNTRDQFYAYGDLDMLEVFSQVGTGGSFCGGSPPPWEPTLIWPLPPPVS